MMLHGILPVWKPTNCTSHDVVAIIRRLTRQKKVGHTGTLDPAVTGVLPICLGRATRIAEYLQEQPKSYEGTFTLGIATDTQDQDGTVIARTEGVRISAPELEKVFRQFTGRIAQTPPMFSAVKVKGQRLYELARQGKSIERKARYIHIYSLELLRIHEGKHPQIDFRVVCSKGTYVRTLCVDIGRALGIPAHLSHLVRTKSGPFTKQHCVPLSELEHTPPVEWPRRWLLPLEAGLTEFPMFTVSGRVGRKVRNGQPIDVSDESFSANTLLRVFVEKEFTALYKVDANSQWARPVKVFAENR